MIEPELLEVALDATRRTRARLYGTAAAAPLCLLGHGAGAGQQSAFMVDFASALADHGVNAVTFNFLYTDQGRKLPDPPALLEKCYLAVIAELLNRGLATRGLFIGGKSMGGRIATQVAAADPALPIAGLVLLGYPLHPPGRPEKTRDAHLPSLARPVLVVQGERDTFGTPAELDPVFARMTPRPDLHVVAGGDHSFKVARTTKAQQRETIEGIERIVAGWILARQRM